MLNDTLRRTAGAAAFLILTGLLAASSQTPDPAGPGSRVAGTVDKPGATAGVIRGRVRLVSSGAPLRNVRITMRGGPGVRDLGTATTDDEGRFELRDVVPGEYRLLATRTGFVMSDEDRATDPTSAGTTVVVGDGTTIDDVEFVLLPGAVIAGQVLSAAGEPLAGAVVHAHREQFHDGSPWPHPDAVAIDLTDDYGRFRLFGLPPGNYFVGARASSGPQLSGPSGGATLALGATFFPGTTVGGEGSVIALRPGDEVGGVVFAVVPQVDTMPAGATAPVPAGQAPAGRPAALRGRVVRQGDGAAVSGAEVVIRTSTGARIVRTTTSDASGVFEITGLEPGAYTVAAAKRGYASLQFGQRRPGEPPETITLGDGDVVDDLTLAIPGGGALEGRVVDSRGEPVAGALVRVMTQGWVRGRRQPVTVPLTPDRTDDRGSFRLHSIPPGTYFLGATIPAMLESPTLSWAAAAVGTSTLFPGATSVEFAQPIVVGSAEDVGGLVITAVDAPPVKVVGFVEDELGRRVRSPSLSLMQRLPFSAGGESLRGIAGAVDGSFTFHAVAPGEYTLVASLGQLSERTAHEQIVVTDRDLVVPLVLRRGSTFAGRITFESEADRKALTPFAVQVRLDSSEPNQLFPGSIDMRPKADWSFEVRGLAGLRRLNVSVPSGWAVKSARAGNTDLLDTALQFSGADVEGVEIALTRRLSEVAGTVAGANGEPVPHAMVVLFAEDRLRRGPESRFVAKVRADRFGRFSHRGLPPERYLAAAVLDLEPGEETNAAALDRLEAQVPPARFTITDGGPRHDLEVPLAR